MLPSLANAKVFTTLDAKNGFWYCWLRMPFGIKPAPEIWQQKQQEVVSGLEGVEVLVDDYLIYGRGDTMEEAVKDHNRNLENLLIRLREANLKLNPEKARIGLREVSFYGFTLSADGLKVDKNKVNAIVNMERPKDVKETQRFLGLCAYLSRFVPKISEVAEPLRRICRKDGEWRWEQAQEVAFFKLKEMIVDAPVLKYFDFKKDTVIECDASSIGLGAVLKQEGHPVAYASRVLTQTEKKYAQIEKECLAIVFACKRFDQYICGKNQILVETDHLPLQSIFKKSLLHAPKRIQRMQLSLQRYNLNVMYKKGAEMHISDVLSRAPIGVPEKHEESEDEVYRMQEIEKILLQISEVNPLHNLRIKDSRLQCIREETIKDKELTVLRDR